MYLPEKITKILSKMNSSYTVHYRGDRISLIEAKEKTIKIYSTNSGCCIDMKGSVINIRDLESLETLLTKLNVVVDKKPKTKGSKSKEDISEIFSETKREVAVEYLDGKMTTVFIEDPKVKVNRTEFGYKIQMGTGEFAVENINSIRIFLEKMNVIPISKKKPKEKKGNGKNELMPGVEQLTLNI